ncbi:hypothetical protein RRF57_004958 [Xylaria bambusicola]|uniref:Uncharacterized protein n=1 Tax=Xylaria bambusicola TaxID=326684 RepID=A0AAN7Z4W2_9PEZI
MIREFLEARVRIVIYIPQRRQALRIRSWDGGLSGIGAGRSRVRHGNCLSVSRTMRPIDSDLYMVTSDRGWRERKKESNDNTNFGQPSVIASLRGPGRFQVVAVLLAVWMFDRQMSPMPFSSMTEQMFWLWVHKARRCTMEEDKIDDAARTWPGLISRVAQSSNSGSLSD